MNPEELKDREYQNGHSTKRLNDLFISITSDLNTLTQNEKTKIVLEFSKKDNYDKFVILKDLSKLDTKKEIADFLLSTFNLSPSQNLSAYDNDDSDDSDWIGEDTYAMIDMDIDLHKPVEEQREKPQLKKREYKSLTPLNELTGLEKVKIQIRELIAHMEIGRLRGSYGLKTSHQTLHMMFKGNPGTGKTTVARMLGEVFKEIGILSKGHVVEIDRSNLVSKFQGEFEDNVKQYVNNAKGGILFIDEIYSLFDDSEKGNDQSKRGVPVLLKLIEDQREDFICIGAGYNDEVNKFLGSNPGLKSRFPIHLDFEDYNIEELIEIAIDMFDNLDYEMNEDFIEKFKECIEEERKYEDFGNARTVRNIVESAIRSQSLRLFNNAEEELDKDSLMNIVGEDFNYVPLRVDTDDKDSDDKKLGELADKLMQRMSSGGKE